jgi:hypothetical protein
MAFQLTKTDAPGKPQNRGITLEGAEEAAMEEGLLENIGSGEVDASYINLEEKSNDRTTTEFALGGDAEHGRTGKVAEIVEDMRNVKLGT